MLVGESFLLLAFCGRCKKLLEELGDVGGERVCKAGDNGGNVIRRGGEATFPLRLPMVHVAVEGRYKPQKVFHIHAARFFQFLSF